MPRHAVMVKVRRALAGTAVGLVLVVGAVACGGDDDPAALTTGTTDAAQDRTGATTSTSAATSTTLREPDAVPDAGPDEAQPTTDPDFEGTIESVTPDDGSGLGQIAIGGEAVLAITDATRLWGCGPTDGRVPIAYEQLAALVGQTAFAWADGPVAESYPVQGRAAAISVGVCG